MTYNCELCQSEFSVLSGRLIIELSKICFLWTYVNHLIIQWRFNVLLQIQFCNIFTNDLSISFANILKIDELPKIYYKIPKYCQTPVLTIVIYQTNSMSQLNWLLNYTRINYIENVPWGQRNLLALN